MVVFLYAVLVMAVKELVIEKGVAKEQKFKYTCAARLLDC